jgi:uncharacterized protein
VTPTAPAPRSERLTVIFKGTDACNGGCRFCSVGAGGARRISDEDFDLLVDRLGAAVRGGVSQLDFTFHGGEPTLLGAGFVDRACARLRDLGVPVRFSMQSNLLDVSDELLEVARRNDIQIGSSVDPLGTDRLTGDGRDAFPAWLEGYARAIAAGFEVGAIFVVTRAAVGQAERVYRAAQALAALGGRPGLQINPVYPQGAASCAPGVLVAPEEYGRFLVDVWSCWEASGRSIDLAPIEAFAAWFERPGTPVALACAYQGQCGLRVGVDFDLRVAGCGRRLDSGAHLGSLRDAELLDLLARSAEREAIAGRVVALERGRCAGCRFFAVCHGGCPDDAALATGAVTDPTPWCAGYRLLFEALEQARTGAAPPPRRIGPAPRMRRTALFVSTDAAEPDPPRERDERLERWLVPDPDGRALRHDGDLDALLRSAAERLVVAVPARRARALVLWREIFADPRVSVALRDVGDDLEPALNVLNAVGAPVWIDATALAAAPSGGARLRTATARFLHDPLWRVPLEPIAGIVRRAADRVHAPVLEAHGLARGAVRLLAGAGGGPALDAVAPGLAGALTDLPMAWLAMREGCAACDAFFACGGVFAVSPRSGCALRPFVASLVAEGEEIARLVAPASPA